MSFRFDETYTCERCGKEARGLSFWTLCDKCSHQLHEERMATIAARCTYSVSEIGGACPTQAQGRTVGDRPFYFRARHGEWTLEVGDVEFPTDYGAWPHTRHDWDAYLIAEGDDPSGGWMEDAEVLAILDEHLEGR